jgi:2-polyprenyl-3-methyl-5-hydroxy-6-metoxy-1,4-benzoquinol methylase
MISDKEFLEAELKMGIDPFNQDFINLCNATANAIEQETTFKTVLDYGAGVGAYADAFHKKGYNVSVYEYFKAHRNYMAENMPHLNVIPKPITTDLMLFIEVAEHMTDKELKALFKKIKPKHILFSSTPNTTDWDLDWGHINIKRHEEWNTTFETLGYEFIKDLTMPTSWSKIYRLK